MRAERRIDTAKGDATEPSGSAASLPGLPGLPGDVESLRQSVLWHLRHSVGTSMGAASERDWFVATVLATRNRIVDQAAEEGAAPAGKRVYYLSLEFLIGRLLADALNNLGLTEPMRAALAGLGVDLDRLRDVEPDAALGNGGLGRLAACFMESMATLGLNACGYGIRYQHGLFRQLLQDGWQAEVPETWLTHGNPWEFIRPEATYPVGFGGQVSSGLAGFGAPHVWSPDEVVLALAYDTPIVGWRGRHVNMLRLWAARAPEPLHLDAFNQGDYVGAGMARTLAASISNVLYPSDETAAGQELRLRQEYFFSSASLQDLVARHMREHGDLRTLADHVAIQLNDTHPAIGIPELMRLAIDVHHLSWDEAWRITTSAFSYTNHTLLPEALESWPIELMERLLPRHMQIIYEINARHLDHLRQAGHGALQAELSLIDEERPRRVRMGTMSFVASHKVNGVSALHSQLMKETVFQGLHRLYPDRIVNKTNGVTFRRWLQEANPGLTRLLVERLGERVLDDPDALSGLAAHVDDPGLHRELACIRRSNKVRLAAIAAERTGVQLDPDALFDVHIKRIHEYKRQLLNILSTIALYHAMCADPTRDWTPRVKLFAGKAAPSYRRAKLIIKLINDVARVVNADERLRGRLKVAFLPNYNVSLAEAMIPAADLSEQISTAGMEASGTGNMKLALNGALTIGTLDGANVELLEHVGADNMVIFGMTAHEVREARERGLDQRDSIAASPPLSAALAAIGNGSFSPDDPNRYRELIDAIVYSDPFMTALDFPAYLRAQDEVVARWQEPSRWWRSAACNTAHVGFFSSDRAIREYASDIWRVAADGPTR